MLIGDGSIAMHCLRALQDAGHQVVACLPETESLAESARQMGIPTHDPHSPLDVIRSIPCDWIISAANVRIIPGDILRLPNKGTLNFHDGPLPEFAGLNVVTRALIDGRDEHGVTWHLVEEGIDTGDIVVQKRVPILADDTSQSLSLRCLQAGMEGFDEIAPLLGGTGQLPRRPQDLARRSYFGSSHWPREGMDINWHWPAARIARMTRALDVGPFPNRVGFARFRINGAWHRLLHAAVCKDGDCPCRDSHIGTLRGCGDGCIHIATADGCLLADSIHPPLADGIVGTVEVTTNEQLARIACWEEGIYRHEARWRSLLQRLSPAADTSPQALAEPLDATIGSTETELGCFLLAWARLHGLDHIQFGRWWTQEEIAAATAAADDPMVGELLHPVAPVHLASGPDDSLREVMERWSRMLSKCLERGPFFSDLLERGGKGEDPMGDPADLALQWFPPGARHEPDREPQLAIHQQGGRWISRSRHDWACLHDLAATLRQILRDDPETKIGDLPRVGHKTLDLLQTWENGAEFETAPPSLLASIFANFSTKPDTIAIETAGGSAWSYRRLGQEVAAWRQRLMFLDLEPGSLIPVRMGRCADMIAAKLAVMASGHAYVPVSEEDPHSRVSEIIRQTRATVAVGSPPGNTIGIHWLGPEVTSVNADPPRHPPCIEDPASQIACIFFTSGSSGQPKGVRITHQGLDAYIAFAIRHYGSEAFESSLWSSSVAFDSTLSEVMISLASGGRVIIPRPESVWSVRGLVQTIRSHEVSYVGIATALWSVWMRDVARIENPIPECLKLVLVGGGTMEPELARAWLEKAGPAIRLHNDYGPTEITVVCSNHRVSARSLEYPGIPIGRPGIGDKVRILDAGARRVAPGVIGEIVIGGIGVAAGYLNQPELTARSFVRIDEGDGFWYRSGDRGSWTADGQLLFHGRFDDQVKIHGYRVEPAEIRQALCRLEGVRDAEVITIGSATSKELAAAVIPADERPIGWPRSLQDQLEGVLARYAIPRRWLILEDWPRTPNGKVDRPRLAREFTASCGGKGGGMGINPLDPDSILDAIRELLHQPEAKPGDSFFGQGGDSIAAINLQVMLEQAVGKTLPLTLVYASRTLQDIVGGVIAHARGSNDAADSHWRVVRENPGGPDLVFMPGMQGYAFLRHLWPGAGAFASIHAIELDPLDYIALSEGVPDRRLLTHLADHFAELIVRHLSGRPPILLGYSAGGWFALETARILQSHGMESPRVILVEPGVRHVGRGLFHLRYLLDSLTNHLIHGWALRKKRKSDSPESTSDLRANLDPDPDPETKKRVSSLFRRMLSHHRPAPTEVPITLVNRRHHGFRFAALGRLARGPFEVREADLRYHMDFATHRSEKLLLDIIRELFPKS